MKKKTQQKIEFGDFQTPLPLARKVSLLLKELGCSPLSILEPTCGEGSFIFASLESFSSVENAIAIDINSTYTKKLAKKLENDSRVKVFESDFFDTDWNKILHNLADPLLIIGNPPWVTNSELSSLGSENLPRKENSQKRSGISAITGASNFDISEWMLLKIFAWARTRKAMVAMLCKTSVARKVLLNEWKNNPNSGISKIFTIDALADFGASVDACLLVHDFNNSGENNCTVFNKLSTSAKQTSFGYQKNQLIANIDLYKKWAFLQNETKNKNYVWRSGIKHDASKIMELKRADGRYINNLGELVDIEEKFLYPMMKSSDVAKGGLPTRFMLVPQHFIGEETKQIQFLAPKTWAYFSKNHYYFQRRKSSIYKNKPFFSIFGVGDYSFSPWKVAISGLYKKLYFHIIAPYEGKPVVLDDTCYFLPCQNEEEAKLITSLLNSKTAIGFYSSFIFWDAKRPITAKILNKLNIMALAKFFQAKEIMPQEQYLEYFSKPEQLMLMEQRAIYGEQNNK